MKEIDILKKITGNSENIKTYFIHELENNRTYEIQELAETYTDLNDRLEWLQKDYSRHIKYYELELFPERKLKGKLYKYNDIDKKQEIIINSKNNRIIKPDEEIIFNIYGIIYYEYQRTKDLIILENIIKQAKKETNTLKYKRYLLKCKSNFDIVENLNYYTKELFNILIDDKINEQIIYTKAITKQSQEHLQWTGEKIELITMFYDLLDVSGLIKGNKETIIKLISINFLDKDKKPFTEPYIRKILKPSEIKAKNRIDLSNLL